MKRFFKCCLLVILCCIFTVGFFGCGEDAPEQPDNSDKTELPVNKEEYTTVEELELVKGDTYDFSAMGLTVDYADGQKVTVSGGKATAVSSGSADIYTHNAGGEKILYKTTVVRTAEKLGGNFRLDKGTFKNKKIVVFGDSITDGIMGNETNHSDTYYSLLCKELGASNDPEDLVNSNFARSATTLTYGLRKEAGISGVERAFREDVFRDPNYSERNVYENILDADLCIIFYGTNDFSENVYKDSGKKPQYDDRPGDVTDAKTIKGGAYYMITRLRTLNENLKILVLPPLYRREDGHIKYTEDKNDVINPVTGEKLSEYGAVLKEVCDELGAKFIDWFPLFNYQNFGATQENTVDGLHPNRNGHKKMFEFLLANAK